jgi:DNA-binding CsgD family transcriptional regulator
MLIRGSTQLERVDYSVFSSTLGRETELTVAVEAIAAACRGAGSVLVVRGAPGIGKTRFLEAARASAERQGALALAATNFSTVRGPFGPFVDLMSDLVKLMPSVIPPLESERVLFERAFGVAAVAPDAAIDRRRIFVLLANAFVRATQRAPLVVAIDDAQWADPESIEFLSYWVTRGDLGRTLIIVAARDDDDDDAVAHALDRFERVRSIDLVPLPAVAARELLAVRMPVGRMLPGRAVDEICDLADGNPLLLEQLIATALAAGGRPETPRSVEQSVRRRMRDLGRPVARTIEIASALGRTFALHDLTAVAGIEAGEALRALREARECDLVDEVPSERESFVFRHEVIRLAVYEGMFAAERAAVHASIARLLEARHAEPELLADHWRRSGNVERAIDFAERAGDAAAALGAYASARNRYLDVIDATRGVARGRIAEKLALALVWLGDTARARPYMRLAIEAHAAASENAKLWELECRYAEIAYGCGDTDDAVAAAQRVLDAVDATDESRFSARVSLALYAAYSADLDAADMHIDGALHEPGARRRIDEERLEEIRATVAMMRGDVDTWLRHGREALRLATSDLPAWVSTVAHLNFALTARELGRGDLARPALATAIRMADENGLVFAGAYARCEAIDVLYALGRLSEALAMIRETIVLQVEARTVRIALTGSALPVLADLDAVESYPGLADRSLIDAAFETGEASRYAYIAAAFVSTDVLAGRRAEAEALIDRALAGITSTRYLAAALFTFARAGTPAQVRRVHDLFAAEPGTGDQRIYRLFVDALAARGAGDRVGFDEAVRAAVRLSREAGLRLLTAYGLELAGKRRDASAIYAQCGAVAQVARLHHPDRLSKRQAEIAELLGQGLTNRAISERLVLSERTVENHVAAILVKTGARNRGEFIRAAGASGRESFRV